MKKLMMAVGLVGLLMMATTGLAQEEADLPSLQGVAEATPDNWNSSESVWKEGRIASLDEKGVVIDDCSYQFTEDTVFCTWGGSSLTQLNFYAGTRVKFVLDSDREIIVKLVRL